MFEKLLEVKGIVWGIMALALIVFISYLFIKNKNKKEISHTLYTKMIVYGGVCVSLSFILSSIRLYKLPQGGSITPASMLPIIIYSCIFGPIPGIMAGVAEGLLQFIQDPFIVHWAQVFLDYPLAFAAVGLSGLFRKNLPLACFMGGFFRLIVHLISGVIFFAEYAGGQNVFLYSLIYNGSFLGIDTLLCIFIALSLMSTPIMGELNRTALNKN